jgi:hypothetical protein
MKKFFSILCAFAIVLGVNAAQVSKKDVFAGKVAKKEIGSQHASTHVAKSATFKAFDNKTASVAKVAAKKQTIAGKEVAGVEKKTLKANVAFKAPQAKKEVFDFTFTSETAEIDWDDHCAEEGWWQIQAENEEAYFSISNLDREEAAGEYAWEDLDPDYTLAFVEDWVYFVDGSCVVDTDDDGNVRVEGSFEGEDGNTYRVRISYEARVIEPGDYDFVALTESHNFYASDNDVYYKFKDAADNAIYFDIIVAEGLEDVELDKVYTIDDMLANYCSVDFDGISSDLVEASFVKTVDGVTEKYEATATDEYGRIFHVSYSFTEPEAEHFETITAEATITKEAYWFWYLYTIEAADEANSIILEILPDDTYYGTWIAGEEITGAVAPLNGQESLIYSGEVTIEPTEDGCTITGKVLCMNNTEYTLNLTYKIPDPTREEVLIITGLELGVYEDAWQLMGYNEDSTKFVSIAAYTDEITGNYTASDLAADYTYVITDITEESYNYFDLLKADISVQFTEEDSTIIIAGDLVCQNGEDIPKFTVLLKGRIPAPEVSDMTFEFSEDEEGITVTPSNNEDAWDWYVVSAEVFEEYGAEGVAEAIYDYYGNAYALTGEQTFTFADDLAYYTSEGGVFYLVVWGSGEHNITTPAASYEFEVEASACTQYDAEEGNDFIVDFASYQIDDRYLADYGVLLISAMSDEFEYLSLQLLLPDGAEGLVAGEYPVLEDGEGPLVYSGYLDLAEGQIYGSFAGNLTDLGQINVPLWLLVEGTVTVAENGAITVDAINCAGAAIKCNLSAAQGIENVTLTEDVKKVVVDGALYIVRDGKMFNVQGAQIR